MPYALTNQLGAALVKLRQAPLDASVAERAATAFLDTIGVMIAGKSEPAVTLLASSLEATGANLDDYGNAALLSGTAAHALDFDDVAFGGHISAVLVSAIMTIAARRDVTEHDVVAAYVAGYETWSELATREKTMYHARGLHPTGLLGSVAAAAAAGSLMALPPEQMALALSIGASQGAGLMSNFGSMTKPFHAGRAAQSGVLAAFLAAQGFTASIDTLESPKGFLAAYSPNGVFDVERKLNLESQGPMLGVTGTSIKRYPVCYAGHRAIDALLDLVERFALDVQRIEHVEITLSDRHSSTLRYREPTSVAEARFSLEFFAGAALSRGWVGLSELSASALRDPAIRTVMSKVKRVISNDLDPTADGYAVFDRATVALRDGTVFESRPVFRAKGHADDPLSPQDARKKFEDCLQSVGRGEVAGSLFEAIAGLADRQDRLLPSLLRREFRQNEPLL